jgi:hypothetical protein
MAKAIFHRRQRFPAVPKGCGSVPTTGLASVTASDGKQKALTAKP